MAEFNFRVTPYPVVLSIENHCSLDQQELMAEIMRIGFGDSLLMPGELMGTSSTGPQGSLPTLEQLKYKVLIKGKRLKVGEGASGDADGDSGDDESGDDNDDDDDDDATVKSGKKAGKNAKKSPALKVHPNLSAIVFLGTCHCTSFAQPASDAIPADMMTSYGESKTIKYVKDDATREGWIYHNRSHLRYVCMIVGWHVAG
jgi:phosphatidylinositol phospholipase C delta